MCFRCLIAALLIHFTVSAPRTTRTSITSWSRLKDIEEARVQNVKTHKKNDRVQRSVADNPFEEAVGMINALPLIDIDSMIGQADESFTMKPISSEVTDSTKEEGFRTVITIEEKIGNTQNEVLTTTDSSTTAIESTDSSVSQNIITTPVIPTVNNETTFSNDNISKDPTEDTLKNNGQGTNIEQETKSTNTENVDENLERHDLPSDESTLKTDKLEIATSLAHIEQDDFENKELVSGNTETTTVQIDQSTRLRTEETVETKDISREETPVSTESSNQQVVSTEIVKDLPNTTEVVRKLPDFTGKVEEPQVTTEVSTEKSVMFSVSMHEKSEEMSEAKKVNSEETTDTKNLETESTTVESNFFEISTIKVNQGIVLTIEPNNLNDATETLALFIDLSKQTTEGLTENPTTEKKVEISVERHNQLEEDQLSTQSSSGDQMNVTESNVKIDDTTKPSAIEDKVDTREDVSLSPQIKNDKFETTTLSTERNDIDSTTITTYSTMNEFSFKNAGGNENFTEQESEKTTKSNIVEKTTPEDGHLDDALNAQENKSSENVTLSEKNLDQNVTTTSTTEVVFVVYSSKYDDDNITTKSNVQNATEANEQIELKNQEHEKDSTTSNSDISTIESVLKNVMSQNETSSDAGIQKSYVTSEKGTDTNQNHLNVQINPLNENQILENSSDGVLNNIRPEQDDKIQNENGSQYSKNRPTLENNLPASENQKNKNIHKFTLRPRPTTHRPRIRRPIEEPKTVTTIEVTSNGRIGKDETQAHKDMINSRRIIVDKMNADIVQSEIRNTLNDKHRFRVRTKNKIEQQKQEQSQLLRDKFGVKPVLGLSKNPKINTSGQLEQEFEATTYGVAEEDIYEGNINTNENGYLQTDVEKNGETSAEPNENDNTGMTLKERLIKMRQDKIKNKYMQTVQNHRKNEKVKVTKSNDLKNKINAMISKQITDENLANNRIKYTPIRTAKPSPKSSMEIRRTDDIVNRGTKPTVQSRVRYGNYKRDETKDGEDQSNFTPTTRRSITRKPTSQSLYTKLMSERKSVRRPAFRPNSISSELTTKQAPLEADHAKSDVAQEKEKELEKDSKKTYTRVFSKSTPRLRNQPKPVIGNTGIQISPIERESFKTNDYNAPISLQKPTTPRIRNSPDRVSLSSYKRFSSPSTFQDTEQSQSNENTSTETFTSELKEVEPTDYPATDRAVETPLPLEQTYPATQSRNSNFPRYQAPPNRKLQEKL